MAEPLVLDVIEATQENFAPYGTLISGKECAAPGLSIPFYAHVEEGKNLPFEHYGKCVVRTARIHPDPKNEVNWIERHSRLTQMFLPLGGEPCVLVLGAPTEGDKPDASTFRAFKLNAGDGAIIHLGTWHDFPKAVTSPVVVITMNSEEVVDALAAAGCARPMDEGDVFKMPMVEAIGRVVKPHVRRVCGRSNEICPPKGTVALLSFPFMATVDEVLYNRQLYVLGHEAQRRLAGCDVLLVGLRGVGVETAKNLALMGVRSITLSDDGSATWFDLSSQFYLSESDVGKPRAAACAARIGDLNQYVTVKLAPTPLPVTPEFLSQFTVVCVTEVPLAVQIQLNEACAVARSMKKEHEIALGPYYVQAEARGVFGRMFADFGEAFVVSDVNGEAPASAVIASIDKGNPGIVTTIPDELHDLQTGDFVTFSEVQGLEELNSCPPVQVTVINAHSFSVGDISHLRGSHTMGGVFHQVKQPQTFSFKRLSAAIKEPSFVTTDFTKEFRTPVVHAAFAAADAFMVTTRREPTPGCDSDARSVIELATSHLQRELSSEEAELVARFTKGFMGQLSPMAAVMGALAAHEVTKAASGKFTPTLQWMYLDCIEALPSPLPSQEECAPICSRYDGQLAVFGRALQHRAQQAKTFLVGAGAIGCEMLKNLAMMGVATLGDGLVTVTDMDRIEKSNLSRQFLFRSTDINKPKSATAARAATAMNPSFHVRALETRVSPDTETTFHSGFWSSLDFVITALDNVEARLYVDSKCVQYCKAMLESGTQGNKGNTQVVVPRVTVNYGATRDPPEKGIPLCTLHHFPNRIEHTLQWARDWFEGEFNQTPSAVNAYLRQPGYLESFSAQPAVRWETIKRIESGLVSERPITLEECIQWARRQFEEKFNVGIAALLKKFPEDYKTTDGGLFWSPPKRAPTPLTFDASDPLHLDFITTCANLRASNYGLTGRDDPEYYAMIAKHAPVSVPAAIEVKVDEAGENVTAPTAFSSSEEAALLSKLPVPSTLAGFRLEPVEFEKDDDLHMACVAAASNLRARNYRITEADVHQSKRIAGKIIPAIATTTALVSGLVCMELYKLLQGATKSLSHFHNVFVNLALSYIMVTEPQGVEATTIALPKSSPFPRAVVDEDGDKVWHWSLWDVIDVRSSEGVPAPLAVDSSSSDSDCSDDEVESTAPCVDSAGHMTLGGFIKYLKVMFAVSTTMVTVNGKILYNSYASGPALAAKLASPLRELIPVELRRPVVQLEACCEDSDGDDVDLPPVRFHTEF